MSTKELLFDIRQHLKNISATLEKIEEQQDEEEEEAPRGKRKRVSTPKKHRREPFTKDEEKRMMLMVYFDIDRDEIKNTFNLSNKTSQINIRKNKWEALTEEEKEELIEEYEDDPFFRKYIKKHYEDKKAEEEEEDAQEEEEQEEERPKKVDDDDDPDADRDDKAQPAPKADVPIEFYGLPDRQYIKRVEEKEFHAFHDSDDWKYDRVAKNFQHVKFPTYIIVKK